MKAFPEGNLRTAKARRQRFRLKLVDTSVWIDFWRGGSGARELGIHLDRNEVLLHPWVLGELALGHLGSRSRAILADLCLLPSALLATDAEVLAFIDQQSLAGRGLGWVDVHLLASARIAAAELWTNDLALARAWRELQ